MKRILMTFLVAMLSLGCLTTVVSAGSIEELTEQKTIYNAGSSVAIVYQGKPARVYYGSQGITIIDESGTIHTMETTFPVRKLVAVGDINRDGYEDFYTWQNALDFSDQLFAVSGKDGKVISSLHLTRDSYNYEFGYFKTNCLITQLLPDGKGNVYVVYDYSVIKVSAADSQIIYSHEEKDNIWRICEINDIDNDGNNEIAGTTQLDTVIILDGKTGDKYREFKANESRNIEVQVDEKTREKVEVNFNSWDLHHNGRYLYVTLEEGKLLRIDLNDFSTARTDLGVMTEDDIQRMAKRQLDWYNYYYYIPTGVFDMGFQSAMFGDARGDYLLIDCFSGSEDARATAGNDFPPKLAVYNMRTNSLEGVCNVPSSIYRYMKSCFIEYEGQLCILTINDVEDGQAVFAVYDLQGNMLVIRNVDIPGLINADSVELHEAESGYVAEVFGRGCYQISRDFSSVSYVYSVYTTDAIDTDSGLIGYCINDRMNRIIKYESDFQQKIWEASFSADDTRRGLVVSRTDVDYNKDGVNDILATLTHLDKEGAEVSTDFIIISGADGSQLYNKKLKIGERTEGRKKIAIYYCADTLDVFRDFDKDGRPELIYGNYLIVSSKTGKQIGYYGGYVDAEGEIVNAGDINKDGMKDYFVITDKETRQYLSKVSYVGGNVSIGYVKGSVSKANDKALSPMTTSGIIGDINNDGINELAMAGYSSERYQIFNIYDGKTLTLMYALCRDGVRGYDEYFTTMEDLNGDGYNELFGFEFYTYGIYDGQTGERYINLSEYDYGGKGDTYHPDYLIPFRSGVENDLYFKGSDITVITVERNGRKYLLRGMYSYERERNGYYVDTLDGTTGDVTNRVFVGNDYITNLQQVEGTDRYVCVQADNTRIVDLEKAMIIAQFTDDYVSMKMLDKDSILALSADGTPYMLSLEKSFNLEGEIPAETSAESITIKWKPLADFSVMSILDNGSVVYKGSDNECEIKLLEGDHHLVMSMDDGRGKAYQEAYDIKVGKKDRNSVLPAAAVAISLVSALGAGIYQKAVIRRKYKGVSR